MRVQLDEPRRLVREHLERALAADPRVSLLPAAGAVPAPTAQVVVRCAAGGAPPAGEHVPSVSLEEHDLADPRAAVAAVLAAAAAGRRPAPSAPARPRPGEAAPPAPAPRVLSRYERTVIEGLARGLTAASVASELAVSPKSVENAKRRAFDKLGARSQAEAVFLVGAAR